MPRSPRFVCLLLALTLAVTLTGCSKDVHSIYSSIDRPTTVTLLDTTQNQAVWEMDIPVNHLLVLDFENSSTSYTAGPDGTPTWADWKLYQSDDKPLNVGQKRGGTLVKSDRVDLTGTRVMMQISYREAPEMPGSLNAAPVPAMDTAESVAAEAAAEAKAQSKAAGSETTDEVIEEAEQAVEEAAGSMEEAAESTEEVDKADNAIK